MSALNELLERYANGRCSEAEKQHVEEWLASYNNHNDEWSKKNEHQQKQWLDATLSDVDKIIDQQEVKDVPQVKIRTNELRSKLKQQLLVAASLILVAGLAVWFFMLPEQKKDLNGNIVTAEILPGKNIATLLLADGISIPLSETQSGIHITPGGINYADGSPVSHTSLRNLYFTSQPAILQTPAGGQYQLILADGTKIWLNAATSVTFTPDLTKSKERKIAIDGEAYLEVTRMRNTFTVQSRGQKITVLGTHFNINNYTNEPAVKTTLLEGSISVKKSLPSAKNDDKETTIILKPGEQAVLKGPKLSKAAVNTDEVVDWKDGDFILDDQDLHSIMRKIARWYNVEVVYEGKLQPMTFLGTISRFKKLSSLLQLLESNGKIHFNVKGRTIIVSP